MKDNTINTSRVELKTEDASGDFVTSVIPLEQRKSPLNLFNTTAGWVICLSTMITGGTLVANMSFKDSLIAGVVGMAILTLFSAPLAGIGSKLGVSTTMIARHTFGKLGSIAFGSINAFLNGIGWFAFQAAFFGLTMKELLPQTLFDNPIVGAVIGGLLMTLTAVFGYNGISILSFVAVPMIIILSVFGGIAGIETAGGWSNIFADAAAKMPLRDGITMVVGNAALGAVILSDITRYGRKPFSGAVSAAGGYMIGGVFCIAAGAAMAVGAVLPTVGTTANLPAIMMKIGLGIGALFILILAQWTTNTANIYSGSISLGTFLPVKQKIVVLSLGIVGTLLAVFNVYTLFIPYLQLLGTALPPIAGVILADYYILTRMVKKGEYTFGQGTKYSFVNILAVGIVLCAALLVGAAKVSLVGAPALDSLIIAFLAYGTIALLFEKAKIPYKTGCVVENERGL